MDESTTLTEVLVRHGIYSHNGIYRIATGDNTLQDLTGTDVYTVDPRVVTLVEAPRSPEWVDRMARCRTSLTRALGNATSDVQAKRTYIENLGHALLAAAEENSLCEQYDAFAKEWDLPHRMKMWHVTVNVQIEARTEEAALETMKGCVSVSYTDGVNGEPEFEATLVEY